MTIPEATLTLPAAPPKHADGGLTPSPWRLCVAPMMDWTDRHCRHFHRLLSPHARLYTEMVNAHAIRHGDRERLLGFDASEHPVALQLGGSDPALLAEAARVGQDWGYDEINLNCGCPSDRVQAGRFGACLMREPAVVADCVAAMRAAVSVPVTVKCRIGVDDQDDDADLQHFIERVHEAGCSVFIVHARKAWLKGLSPKENRDVPPLNYPRVHRLRQDFPDLTLVLNGGLTSVPACVEQVAALDGVMLGRSAYHEPWILAELEQALFASAAVLPERAEVLQSMRSYTEARLASGDSLGQITRHILGLFQGLPGARRFRRVLSERAHRAGAGWEVVEAALNAMKDIELAA
jgi:tRNA-dihydrouridine synthase A